MRKLLILLIYFSALQSSAAFSAALEGTRQISLLDQSGTKVVIGEVSFRPFDDGAIYDLRFDAAPFSDHFLSMRPFKCVEGAQKHWCHVPYPYEIRRQVTPRDLTDLEYDLLFLWKGATEYGINMWNGVYYQLEVDGDRILGTLMEMDMDTLSAPPEPGNLRPLTADVLHDADPDSHWLPQLVIE